MIPAWPSPISLWVVVHLAVALAGTLLSWAFASGRASPLAIVTGPLAVGVVDSDSLRTLSEIECQIKDYVMGIKTQCLKDG